MITAWRLRENHKLIKSVGESGRHGSAKAVAKECGDLTTEPEDKNPAKCWI